MGWKLKIAATLERLCSRLRYSTSNGKVFVEANEIEYKWVGLHSIVRSICANRISQRILCHSVPFLCAAADANATLTPRYQRPRHGWAWRAIASGSSHHHAAGHRSRQSLCRRPRRTGHYDAPKPGAFHANV